MVKSRLITLNDIINNNYYFNIPIYQRLYVWGKEQVQTLLCDIWEACKDEKEVFYLGGTLVIDRSFQHDLGRDRLFDLIDGQQRFTTLWLIAIAWKRSLSEYRFEESEKGYKHRIKFAIRPKVQRFFHGEFIGETVNYSETIQLQDALKEIRDFPNNRKQDGEEIDLQKLTIFIREKVKLVFTEVPENTDLNRLFEVINNRGVQLQHHEILKARLLGVLASKERGYYGHIWDACSYMNDYVEKNLRDVTGLKIIKLFNQGGSRTDSEELASAKSVIRELKSLDIEQEEKPLSLSDILALGDAVEQDRTKDIEEGYESERVRSIITFSMLLQHTLRIFLANEKQADINKILDKDLITIFEQFWLRTSPSSQKVKLFLELLWEIRYLFDKHIIKWVEAEEGETLAIRRLRINRTTRGNKNYRSLIRDTSDAEPSFSLLQSMLYHSQQMTTHYWLTPLLNYLRYEGSKSAHTYLKYLDNHLLCAFDEEPLIERTKWFIDDYWCSEEELDISTVLKASEGTDFAHYWFYKLEYILWEQKREEMGNRWKVFKMTAKNSVEHISPQNPEKFDSNTVSKEKLNCFGNLSLVSRSINSEYSNKPYSEKRARFKEKNRIVVDSLKMDLIFKNDKWNDELAQKHLEDVLVCVDEYFSSVERESMKLR